MFAHAKYWLMGSAVLLASMPAFCAEESAGVVSAPVRTAVVKCPGIKDIPFTVDAEQALPLKIAGALSCGETVALLSDTEGYTAQVRTRDGHEGYVALMYLALDAGNSSALVAPKHASAATPVNGVVRWGAGGEGCDEFLSHGRHVESVTANGVTVQVSIQDTGWKYRANIAISNQSGETLEVLPGIITLDELTPKTRSLYASSPEKLAHTPTHQVLWTLVDAVPSRSAVANGAGSTTERLAYRNSAAPDYLSPHVALASAHHGAFDRSQTADLEALSMKPGTVANGQVSAGVMWFDRDSDARELSLRVPAGGLVFDFAFSFEQKK